MDYAHLFNSIQERYSQTQCQLCHLQQSLMTVCGLRQLQKGYLRAHKAEAWGTKLRQRFCMESVCGQDLHSLGERQRRAGLPQELSWWDLQEEISSFWPQTMFWATHHHSASQVRELCSLPIAQWLSWAPGQSLKHSALKLHRTATTALLPEIKGTLATVLIPLPSTSVPYLLPPQTSVVGAVRPWMSMRAWLGPQKWRTEAAIRVCLTLGELGEY